MVDLLNPQEGQLICAPGMPARRGFLIRAFEHVRAKIVADIQTQKDAERVRIEALKLPEEDEEQQIEAAFSRLNKELLPSGDDNKPIDTRVGRLAWQCIYGTDAEPRAARTAKMNMIMHGDGHGGIHYHDGLLDINGIFNGRFDLVLTNPPFGSNVGNDQKVGGSDETRVPTDTAYLQRCRERGYGEPWEESHHRLLQAATAKTPILDLFEIGKGKSNRPTELIFVERCLNLLKPGGRMGIVLPDGNLNNPSLAWLRRWTPKAAPSFWPWSVCLKKPSAPATPRSRPRSCSCASFTEAEAAQWEADWAQAHAELDAVFDAQRKEAHASYASRILSGDDAEAARLLAELAALGIQRTLLPWQSGEAPAYPRQAQPRRRATSRSGRAKPPRNTRPAELKKQASAALATVQKRSDALLSELKARYQTIDEAHTPRCGRACANCSTIPSSVGRAKTVGMHPTGETGGEGWPANCPSCCGIPGARRLG